MASAINLKIDALSIEEGSIKLGLQVLYYDTTLSVLEEKPVYVKFSPSATIQQISTAITNAIIAQAQSYWPTMVLTATDIITFDIRKG